MLVSKEKFFRLLLVIKTLNLFTSCFIFIFKENQPKRRQILTYHQNESWTQESSACSVTFLTLFTFPSNFHQSAPDEAFCCCQERCAALSCLSFLHMYLLTHATHALSLQSRCSGAELPQKAWNACTKHTPLHTRSSASTHNTFTFPLFQAFFMTFRSAAPSWLICIVEVWVFNVTP